jgi:hypothetical protein
MKRALIAALAVTAITAGSALAQTTVTTTAPGAGATVTIAPEQRTKIKQYVVQQKVKPMTMKERVVVGATLPADVELMTVPSDWGPELGSGRGALSLCVLRRQRGAGRAVEPPRRASHRLE